MIKNTAVKTIKRINFVKKTINFDFSLKKNPPAAGPLSGSSLSGGQPPAARCAGAKMRENFDHFYRISELISIGF